LRVLAERADSLRPDQVFTFRELAARVEARVRDALGSAQVPNWGRLDDGQGDFLFVPTLWRLTPAVGSARRAYAAAMAAAQAALARRDLTRVDGLLEDQRPRRGEVDLRGFEWFYLWKRAHPEQLCLRGSAIKVVKTVFSADDRSIIAWYADGTVREWSLVSGRVRTTRDVSFDGVPSWTNGERYLVEKVEAFPAAGFWAASGRELGTRLLDVKDNRSLRILSPRSKYGRGYEPVEAMALSPDGLTVAWTVGAEVDQDGPFERDIRTWQWRENSPTTALHLSIPRSTKALTRHPYVALELSPVGVRLAAATDVSLTVVETRSGRWRAPVVLHDGKVTALEFMPDGTAVIGVTDDGDLWRFEAGGEGRKTHLAKGGLSDCSVLAISPSGDYVATADKGRGIDVRDLQDGHLITSFPDQSSEVTDLAFSLDSQRLASGGADGTVKLWALRDSQRTFRFDPFEDARKGGKQIGETSIEFAPSGQTLATSAEVSDGKSVSYPTRFWDVGHARQRLLSGFDTNGPSFYRPKAFVFSPTGESVVSIETKAEGADSPRRTQSAVIREVATAKRTAVLDAAQVDGRAHETILRAFEDVAFTADGRWLIGAERPNIISRWSTSDWARLASATLSGDPDILRLAIAQDSHSVAVTQVHDSGLCTMTLCDLPGPGRVRTLGRFFHPPELCAFTPDGAILVCVWQHERLLRLFDVESGKPRATLALEYQAPPPGGNWDLVFHPSSRYFFLVTPSLEIRSLEAHSGRELATRREKLRGQSTGGSVAMDRDGRAIVSCEEGAVVFLDPATLNDRFVLLLPEIDARNTAISPRGTDLAILTGRDDVAICRAASVSESFDPVEAAATGIKDQDEQVRRNSADVLGGLGRLSAQARAVLIDALADRSAAVRGAAAEAIVRLGVVDSETLSGLVRLLDEPDENARRKGIAAFLRLGFAPPQARERIKAILRGDSSDLARIALEALRRIDPDPESIINEVLEAIRSKSEFDHSADWVAIVDSLTNEIVRLVMRWERLVPAYVKLLRLGRDAKGAVRAIEALSSSLSNTPGVLDAIAAKLNDANESVRFASAKAIALGVPDQPDHRHRVAEILTETLEASRLAQVYEAADALGELGPTAAGAIPALRRLWEKTEDQKKKASLTFAIRRIESGGATRVRRLIELSDDADPSIKARAIRKLGSVGHESKEAKRRLEQIAQDDKQFSEMAREELTLMGFPMSDP
jgi:WD40 repeat protein/HEAT repeat protein